MINFQIPLFLSLINSTGITDYDGRITYLPPTIIYPTFTSLTFIPWRLISENETKCSNFEQNRSTKSQKAAGVRIVLVMGWGIHKVFQKSIFCPKIKSVCYAFPKLIQAFFIITCKTKLSDPTQRHKLILCSRNAKRAV